MSVLNQNIAVDVSNVFSLRSVVEDFTVLAFKKVFLNLSKTGYKTNSKWK